MCAACHDVQRGVLPGPSGQGQAGAGHSVRGAYRPLKGALMYAPVMERACACYSAICCAQHDGARAHAAATDKGLVRCSRCSHRWRCCEWYLPSYSQSWVLRDRKTLLRAWPGLGPAGRPLQISARDPCGDDAPHLAAPTSARPVLSAPDSPRFLCNALETFLRTARNPYTADCVVAEAPALGIVVIVYNSHAGALGFLSRRGLPASATANPIHLSPSCAMPGTPGRAAP